MPVISSMTFEIAKRLSIAISVVCAFQLTVLASLPSSAAEGHGPMILQFPTDHPFGTIRFDGTTKPIAVAQGKVEVPAGAQVVLAVNYESAKDLSPLRKLAPDSLYKLNLRKLEISNDQLRNIENLTGLIELELEETNVSDEGLRSLHKLNKLGLLNITATRVTGKGLVHLKPLSNLHKLRMATDQIGNEGLENLVSMKNLKDVYMNRSGITDAGLRRLAPMSQLRKLDIGFNKVTDAGIASLVGLKNLQILLLENTSVSPNCLKSLKQLPSLRELSYSGNNFSAKDAEKIAKALPRCKVEDLAKHRNLQFELLEPLH